MAEQYDPRLVLDIVNQDGVGSSTAEATVQALQISRAFAEQPRLLYHYNDSPLLEGG